jgi:hypothetical protein
MAVPFLSGRLPLPNAALSHIIRPPFLARFRGALVRPSNSLQNAEIKLQYLFVSGTAAVEDPDRYPALPDQLLRIQAGQQGGVQPLSGQVRERRLPQLAEQPVQLPAVDQAGGDEDALQRRAGALPRGQGPVPLAGRQPMWSPAGSSSAPGQRAQDNPRDGQRRVRAALPALEGRRASHQPAAPQNRLAAYLNCSGAIAEAQLPGNNCLETIPFGSFPGAKG